MSDIKEGGLSGPLTDRERGGVFHSDERGGSPYPKGFGSEAPRPRQGSYSNREIGEALARGDGEEAARMLEANKRAR